MSWKCKLGFHRWVNIGGNLMLTDTVKQCRRCKVGLHLIQFGQAQVQYTPEAMREAWDMGKIDSPEAKREIYGESR